MYKTSTTWRAILPHRKDWILSRTFTRSSSHCLVSLMACPFHTIDFFIFIWDGYYPKTVIMRRNGCQWQIVCITYDAWLNYINNIQCLWESYINYLIVRCSYCSDTSDSGFLYIIFYSFVAELSNVIYLKSYQSVDWRISEVCYLIIDILFRTIHKSVNTNVNYFKKLYRQIEGNFSIFLTPQIM